MDEGNGSSTIDQSGNGNIGNWLGAPTNGSYYTGGKVGNYAGNFVHSLLDGVNLGNPSTLQPAGAFTAVTWINAPPTNNFSAVIANFSNTSGPFHIYTGASGANGIRCLFNNGANGLSYNSTPVNTWYQVACTWNGSVINLYINGISVGTSTYSGSLSYSNNFPWWIGADGTSTPGDNFNGSIDDVRIYNRALSPAEIMALYSAER